MGTTSDRRQLLDELITLSSEPLPKSINQQLGLIKQLLTQISAFRKDKKTKDELSSGVVTVFKQWLRDNDVETGSLDIEYFQEFGYGLKTNARILQNNEIVSVPKRVMLSLANERPPSQIRNFVESQVVLKSMPNVALAFYLLYQKYKKKSFWKPYLDMLPHSYNTCLYFTIEDFIELKCSSILPEAIKLYRDVCRQFAYLSQQLSTNQNANLGVKFIENFNFDTYCWAVSTVMTRQNLIPELGMVLIPFWDLCNHKNGYITSEYDPETERCKCYAMEDLEPNQQVFIYYGDRSNSDFFLHNGFVYGDNENDGYLLKLGVGTSDLLRGKRLQVLKKFGMSENQFNFKVKLDTNQNKMLHLFLRVLHMETDELESVLVTGDMGDTTCEGLDEKSNLYLRTRILLIMKSYQLNDNDNITLLSPTQTIVRQFKICEKRFLGQLLQLYERRC